MAIAIPIPDDTIEQQIAALEMRYRHAEDSLNKARALHARMDLAGDEDDLEARHAMARIQHLQAKLVDLQEAIDRLGERASR